MIITDLSAAFVVRQLLPWHENLSKRQVKAPKIYFTDSGLLHALLGIRDMRSLLRHPKVGASWEGFALAQVESHLRLRRNEAYFWATQAGAEIDLVVMRGGRRHGCEFKRTSVPSVTPSMRTALADLHLDRIDVVHAGEETWPLAPRIRAVALSRLAKDIPPR